MRPIARIGIVAGVAALVLFAWIASRSSGRGRGWVTLSCEHMATTISATVPADGEADRAGRIISDTFAEIDAMMSEWKPGSPLTAVNDHAGEKPVAVPPELLSLIEESLEIGEATGGAFDITWAALWGVWDFKAAEPAVPDAAVIDERRGLVDYRRVEIDREAGTVSLPEPGMKIGLGAIAKGYAIDVAAERMRDAGFEDFMLIAGGQVYAAGERDGRAWRVGIRDPRGGPNAMMGWVDLRDQCVSTSGDYERFFEIDGVRYHHILDPRTGRPSVGARSVTVVSERATLADALSTAGMILGPQRGLSFAEASGVWMLVVGEDGVLTISPGPGPVMGLNGSQTP